MSSELFSAFSRDDFDAKTWVNQAWQHARSAGSGDVGPASASQVQGIITKLQSFIKKINQELDDVGQRVLDDLPSVARRADAAVVEVAQLRGSVEQAKQDVERVAQTTASAMSQLVSLDRVRMRMVESSSALQEADSWANLLEEAEKAFASKDIKRMASALLGLQRSLVVLADAPDHAARQKTVASLQGTLEEMILPPYLDAISRHDAAEARTLVAIFTDMSKHNTAVAHYRDSRRTFLEQEWQSCMKSDDSLEERIKTFHTSLKAFIADESKFVNEVLPEAKGTVAAAAAHACKEAEPSMESLLHSYLAEGEEQLDRLDRCLHLTTDLVAELKHDSDRYDALELARVTEALMHPFAHYQVELGALLLSLVHRHVGKVQPQISSPSVAPADDTEETSAPMQNVTTVDEEARRLAKCLGQCLDYTISITDCGAVEGLSDAAAEGVRVVTTQAKRCLASLRNQFNFEPSNKKRASATLPPDALEASISLVQVSGRLLQAFRDFRSTAQTEILRRRYYLLDQSEPQHLSLPFDYLAVRSVLRTSLADMYLPAVQSGTDWMNEAYDHIIGFCDGALSLAFEVSSQPIASFLESVATNELWASKDTDDEFSLSAQAYATQMGEHLLSFPQQLEPLFQKDDAAMRAAIQSSQLEVSSSFSVSTLADADPELLLDFWMEQVASSSMKLYLESILQIKRLTPGGRQQLCADIDYLFNVLSALDITPLPDVNAAYALLSASDQAFADTASTFEEQHAALCKTIKKMRRL